VKKLKKSVRIPCSGPDGRRVLEIAKSNNLAAGCTMFPGVPRNATIKLNNYLFFQSVRKVKNSFQNERQETPLDLTKTSSYSIN